MENEKKPLKLVVWLLLVTSHSTAKNEGKLMEKNEGCILMLSGGLYVSQVNKNLIFTHSPIIS